MKTKPTRYCINFAHMADFDPSRCSPVPIYYRRPSRLSANERVVHANSLRHIVSDYRRKSGLSYTAARKWISQLCVPRIAGTLYLPEHRVPESTMSLILAHAIAHA